MAFKLSVALIGIIGCAKFLCVVGLHRQERTQRIPEAYDVRWSPRQGEYPMGHPEPNPHPPMTGRSRGNVRHRPGLLNMGSQYIPRKMTCQMLCKLGKRRRRCRCSGRMRRFRCNKRCPRGRSCMLLNGKYQKCVKTRSRSAKLMAKRGMFKPGPTGPLPEPPAVPLPEPPAGKWGSQVWLHPQLPPISPVCALPKRTTPCYDRNPGFFFDSRTGRCDRIPFGRCMMNRNDFQTLRQCVMTCSSLRDRVRRSTSF